MVQKLLLCAMLCGLLVCCVLVHPTLAAKKASKSGKAVSASDAKSKCDQCHKIVDKFLEGVAKTSTDIEFTGESKGWSKDNEKFLGKYSMNEAQLVEVIEGVCARNHKCATMLEAVEEHLEDWWNEHREAESDLKTWLCIETASYCCAPGHYGASCKSCPALDGDTPCNGHGTCDGDGVRGGTGKCKCTGNFKGKTCSKCMPGFFMRQTATDPVISTCEACDSACKMDCNGPGPTHCMECADGYQLLDGTCVDINECESNPCTEDLTVCNNLPGSFECAKCDVGCLTACTAPGLEGCTDCAEGYKVPETGVGCQDIDECDAESGTASCAENQFCRNTPGSFQCMSCSSACNGCTGTSAKDCISCADGFEERENGECVDINECQAFPCASAETCINTDGSHECVCKSPAVEADGSCQYSDELAQAVVEAVSVAAEQTQDKTDFSTEQGEVQVTASETNSKLFKIDFSQALAEPTVSELTAIDVCCGDKFELKYTGLTADGFNLLAQRTDAQSGWGQSFTVKWKVLHTSPVSSQHDEL
eukprot:m.62242 g.62242  ORF g.62242 m.62242 type:complete len:536 (+) comp11901_c0_seq1:259-1866(+)